MPPSGGAFTRRDDVSKSEPHQEYEGALPVDLDPSDDALYGWKHATPGTDAMNDNALRATRIVCLTLVIITLIIYLQDYIHLL